MTVTVTLYNYIKSELVKEGFNEFTDGEITNPFFDGLSDVTLFEDDTQFMTKILNYDSDVEKIVNRLFNGLTLKDVAFDRHFKKTFVYRFMNRYINKQTIESFKIDLLSTFLMHENYINTVYSDLDTYLTQTQTNDHENKQLNKQLNDGTTVTDNRQAFADLPQNNVQLDLDSTVMDSATDNTISRNKQVNTQLNDGETDTTYTGKNKIYKLDELIKSNGMLENMFDIFDRKCFMQIW